MSNEQNPEALAALAKRLLTKHEQTQSGYAILDGSNYFDLAVESAPTLARAVLELTGKRRRFPVQGGPSVPWALIEPHEAQAKHNHDQSLERLAERGGLSPYEAVCVLTDRSMRTLHWRTKTEEEWRAELQSLLDADVTAERDGLLKDWEAEQVKRARVVDDYMAAREKANTLREQVDRLERDNGTLSAMVKQGENCPAVCPDVERLRGALEPFANASCYKLNGCAAFGKPLDECTAPNLCAVCEARAALGELGERDRPIIACEGFISVDKPHCEQVERLRGALEKCVQDDGLVQLALRTVQSRHNNRHLAVYRFAAEIIAVNSEARAALGETETDDE